MLNYLEADKETFLCCNPAPDKVIHVLIKPFFFIYFCTQTDLMCTVQNTRLLCLYRQIILRYWQVCYLFATGHTFCKSCILVWRKFLFFFIYFSLFVCQVVRHRFFLKCKFMEFAIYIDKMVLTACASQAVWSIFIVHMKTLAIQNLPSEDSDQTTQMYTLIRILAGLTCLMVCFLML